MGTKSYWTDPVDTEGRECGDCGDTITVMNAHVCGMRWDGATSWVLCCKCEQQWGAHLESCPVPDEEMQR